MDTSPDLLIAGAGPAGLAHAFWRLHQDPDLSVRVVDGAPEAGGWVRTRRIEGYVCETGPQGIRPTEVSDEFVAALGIGDAVVPASDAAKARFIARDGTLHAMPAGPGDLFKTDILTFAGKLSLLLEPLRGRGTDAEESLAEFVGRRFGRQMVPVAEALASGVFGGDAHAVEMAAAFPAIADLERQHGSLIRGMLGKRRNRDKSAPRVVRPPLSTFTGGMDTLVRALRTRLGARLTLGREVRAITKAGDGWQVVLGGDAPTTVHARELALAIPARRAAPLLAPTDAELAATLSDIPFASIANIYLGFEGPEAAQKLLGFGFLLDRREASPMLGAIYCSSIFPHSAPDGRFLVRIMAGGMVHPDAVDRDEEDLAAEAEAMLRKYTGLTARLAFHRVYKARDAIPQYVRGHSARLRRIRELAARHAGLRLLGNSYDEVSVVGQLRRPELQPT